MKFKDWLLKEPLSLSLSSGLFGFFAHTGFCKALESLPIQFKILRGSSAGSLVAAALAARIKAEDFSQILFEIRREDFWDPSLGLGYLKGEKLIFLLEKYLPKNFEDLAFPLQISCFDLRRMKTTVIDSGPLAPALTASCRVPLFFHPSKQGSQWLVDGGVHDHLALFQAQTEERILCHQLSPAFPWDFSHKKIPLFKDFKRIQLQGVDRSGPFQLSKGPMIVEQAYAQTQKKLNEDLIHSPFFEAQL